MIKNAIGNNRPCKGCFIITASQQPVVEIDGLIFCDKGCHTKYLKFEAMKTANPAVINPASKATQTTLRA